MRNLILLKLIRLRLVLRNLVRLKLIRLNIIWLNLVRLKLIRLIIVRQTAIRQTAIRLIAGVNSLHLLGSESATTAKFCIERKRRSTTRTRKSLRRIARAYQYKRTIAAFSAKFHAFGKPRLTICASHDAGH